MPETLSKAAVKRRAEAEGWSEWLRSDLDWQAAKLGYWFDIDAAEHVRQFCRRFVRHSKGRWAGQPFELLDWQWRDVVAPLFGWKRPDGRRRYTHAYIEVPKKGGKSTLWAALTLYLLVADGEAGAEVYIAAADRDQASIIFSESANMVEASPNLASRLQVVRSTKRIISPLSNSLLKALSADVPTKEGLNASAVLFDELHVQPNAKLWETLEYACLSREQPIQASITTAGEEAGTICWEQHEYALDVNRGLIEDLHFLGVIYAADPEDDWTAPATWKKANPSLGETITLEGMEADCIKAQSSPRRTANFKRYRLNLWGEGAEAWLSLDAWDACGQIPVDIEALKGRECFGGLDLSTIRDISALVLLFPDTDVGYYVLPHFFIPAERMQARKDKDHVDYPLWVRQGFITATEGNRIDYKAIRNRVNEYGKLYSIRDIGFDPWNAEHLCQELAEDDGFSMVEYRQGYRTMSGPSKEFEACVEGCQLAHGGNPVLRWMAGNARVRQDDNENIMPSKAKSRERIDGIVACIIALGRALADDDETGGPSVYEERGVVTIDL